MVNQAILGATQLVFFNTGTVTVPVWTALEGQRKGDLKRPTKDVESTNKDSYPDQTFVYGYRGWSVEVDGVWIVDSVTGLQPPGIAYVQHCRDNMIYPHVMLVAASPLLDTPVLTYEGTMLITTWDQPGPYDNLVTYTGSLKGSGAYLFNGQ